jgi:hypothetical protein
MLALMAGWPHWGEALFPGFITIALGLAAVVLVAIPRRATPSVPREREAIWLYGSLGLLAFWASFGPGAGLYALLFRIPVFSFLRAPSRFGLVVMMSLAVLAAFALQRLLTRLSARWRLGTSLAVAALVAAELNVLPFPWERARHISTTYAILSGMPRGPVAEFPFYGGRVALHLHTQYMLFSTAHWMPLVNGYSDHIPARFREDALVLDSFPSNDAFAVLKRYRVRYIGVHWDMFGPRAEEIRNRLQRFARYLSPLGSDGAMTLYEVVGFP